jgi:opacity protein-like surface antigen
MMRMILSLAALAVVFYTGSVSAECVGSGEYEVCSDSYTDAAGNIHVSSHDTEGNSYSVDSDSHVGPSGEHVIESHDSAGNSYSVKSWHDASGIHSVDSEGHSCTITPTGKMIGC